MAVELKNAIKIFSKNVSDFTRGEGGVSAESDMSDFWPDFFLQTAPYESTGLTKFSTISSPLCYCAMCLES